MEGLKAATATTMDRIDVKACAARVMARSNTSTRTRLAMDLPASRPTAVRASQPLTCCVILLAVVATVTDSP